MSQPRSTGETLRRNIVPPQLTVRHSAGVQLAPPPVKRCSLRRIERFIDRKIKRGATRVGKAIGPNVSQTLQRIQARQITQAQGRLFELPEAWSEYVVTGKEAKRDLDLHVEDVKLMAPYGAQRRKSGHSLR